MKNAHEMIDDKLVKLQILEFHLWGKIREYAKNEQFPLLNQAVEELKKTRAKIVTVELLYSESLIFKNQTS